ncbi:unnamed protein product [Phytophthora lilii]|uniref:Unnamed protein product n=1 Tax=Phytophthora lilii TaxID=2077276 RepID=A0A9W6YH77_9STRA|nr:unnamed protein product [Phytophthora lilii]
MEWKDYEWEIRASFAILFGKSCTWRAQSPYPVIAERLKNTEEVTKLVQMVKQFSVRRETDSSTMPFILLQGSSGVGKTHMAFNLMVHDDLDVIYATMASSWVSPGERY